MASKKLTESAAWFHLYDKWCNATIPADGEPYIYPVGLSPSSDSICDSIKQLTDSNVIDWKTDLAMMRRLKRHKPKVFDAGADAYFFPRDREGADARAQLCLKLAKLAKKQESK